jgi:hypothetical protein
MLGTRSRSRGFVLVIVIAAIAVAAMIAGSYLIFVDDHRQRITRVDDEAITRIGLEQNILRLQSEIRALVKNEGKVDLQGIDLSAGSNPLSKQPSAETLKLTLDGYSSGVARLDSIARSSDAFTPLDRQGDPFLGARASILKVEVKSSGLTSLSSLNRLSVKRVTASPEIDIRSIPVSQFTAFSSGTGLDLDTPNFSGSLGRIFAFGDIELAGRFSSDYPVVTGGSVFANRGLIVFPGTSSPVQIPGDFVAYAQPVDSSQAGWLAKARTQYDDAVVTPGSLPVSLILPPNTNAADSPNPAAASAAPDLATIRDRCDLLLLVHSISGSEYGITLLRGRPEWLMGLPAVKKAGTKGAAAGKVIARQTDPVVARKMETNQANGQVVVAFNYGAFSQEARRDVHSICFEFDGSVTDSFLLVRGAKTLQGNITIACQWPVLVAGDLNIGPNPVAVSILTAQGVSSVGADWDNATFGFAP